MSRDIFKSSAVKWFRNCLQLCLSQISARGLLCLCELFLCPHVRSAVVALLLQKCMEVNLLIRCDVGSTQQKQSIKLFPLWSSTMAVKWRWSLCPVVPNTETLKRLYVLDMQVEAKRVIFIAKNLKEVSQMYQSSCESSSGCWRPNKSRTLLLTMNILATVGYYSCCWPLLSRNPS